MKKARTASDTLYDKYVKGDKEMEADWENAKKAGRIAKKVVGKPIKTALKAITAAGMTGRIASEDGVGDILTCEFRPTRINLEVEKGIVANAFVG